MCSQWYCFEPPPAYRSRGQGWRTTVGQANEAEQEPGTRQHERDEHQRHSQEPRLYAEAGGDDHGDDDARSGNDQLPQSAVRDRFTER